MLGVEANTLLHGLLNIQRAGEDNMADLIGGTWRIMRSLAETGQSWTYLVEHTQGDPPGEFAAKLLKNPQRLGRFEKEIEALKALDHPGIAKLVDFDLEGETAWFVQEFLRGGDLEAYVRQRGAVLIGKALEWFQQISEALSFAHARDFIHRDVKPANVFLKAEEGPPVLGDFGLTFHLGEQERLTLTEEQVGSRFFMAPELRDGRIDEPIRESDVYSLGKVLYYMLNGGRVMDREDFRSPRWDLVALGDDPLLEHANSILDKMITFRPEERLSAEAVAQHASKARRLAMGGFPSLEGRHLSRCRYCGDGMYIPRSRGNGEYTAFFSFSPSAVQGGAADWGVMVCDNCGHVELFRLELAGKKEWWPKPQ